MSVDNDTIKIVIFPEGIISLPDEITNAYLELLQEEFYSYLEYLKKEFNNDLESLEIEFNKNLESLKKDFKFSINSPIMRSNQLLIQVIENSDRIHNFNPIIILLKKNTMYRIIGSPYEFIETIDRLKIGFINTNDGLQFIDERIHKHKIMLNTEYNQSWLIS